MTSTDVYLAPSVSVSERVRSLDVPSSLGVAAEAMEYMDSSSTFQALHKADAFPRVNVRAGSRGLVIVKIDSNAAVKLVVALSFAASACSDNLWFIDGKYVAGLVFCHGQCQLPM